ncbi:MAG: glycosyltransferase family 2 protein [Euzebyales bacterium]|nr:glycosyltransferase family 2 protein [Euzebyales bacterium]
MMIPTYNGERYLADALNSVLAQDPGPAAMQVEVVDDRSTRGDPEAIVRRAGERVTFFRQPSNVGHAANFNTCLRRARGTVVHLLHDDDWARDGFYRRLEPPLRDNPEVGAAFSRYLYADGEGHWRTLSRLERRTPGVVEDWLPKIASGQRLTTPSVVVRRSVYELLGGFDERITVGGEDWEMWVRIATRFPVWFEPEPLAVYRVNRPGSLTGNAASSAALARDMLLATDIVAAYLPTYLTAGRADTALRRARAEYSRWAVEAAHRHLLRGQRRAAFNAARLALSGGPKPQVMEAMLETLARSAVHRLRSRRH